VNDRRLSSYIDALIAGRRPAPFPADPEDVEAVRTAIELRAARPGDAVPDDQFVSDLYESLTKRADSSTSSNVTPIKKRRARAALFAAAASVMLIGGTFAATASINHSPATTAAITAPRGQTLRTGTFETPSGEVLGQVVAYDGHPSWVYMDIGVSQTSGRILCKLQLKNGSIVSTGTIELRQGTGVLSKYVHVDIRQLRGAQLFSPTGSVLASATFD
jgi:hypothetical protein